MELADQEWRDYESAERVQEKRHEQKLREDAARRNAHRQAQLRNQAATEAREELALEMTHDTPAKLRKHGMEDMEDIRLTKKVGLPGEKLHAVYSLQKHDPEFFGRKLEANGERFQKQLTKRLERSDHINRIALRDGQNYSMNEQVRYETLQDSPSMLNDILDRTRQTKQMTVAAQANNRRWVEE
jgi:hypothetical protein